eukprot:3255671-Karenia_brevis.AAC.1
MGVVRDCVPDPVLLRLPLQREDTPRAPKVWCPDEEWPDAARNLVDPGICSVMEETDIPMVNGRRMPH